MIPHEDQDYYALFGNMPPPEPLNPQMRAWALFCLFLIGALSIAITALAWIGLESVMGWR